MWYQNLGTMVLIPKKSKVYMMDLKLKITSILIFILFVIFDGCSTSPKVDTGKKAEPAIVIRAGSLYVGQLNRRITIDDVENLSRIIEREKIEILTIQDLTRYPSVKSRLDLLDELNKRLGYRVVSGETETISGRQVINAVLSNYPVLSHHNISFDKIKSSVFSGALLVSIDAGLEAVTLASAKFPDESGSKDLARCVELILGSNQDAKNPPIIVITGNLPQKADLGNSYLFKEIELKDSQLTSKSRVWYTSSDSFKLLGRYITESKIGKIVVFEMAIFKKH